MVPGKLGKLSRSVSIIGIGATPFMNINDDPDLLGLTEGDCFGYAALAAMESDIRRYEAENKTGNPVLDTLLTAKSLYCQQHGINMTCVADGKLLDFLSTGEICTIVGTALDNATESVAAEPDPEKKLIRVAIYAQNGFVMLRFENYCADPVELGPDGRPARSSHGGYDLKSVRAAAEAHGGTLTLHWENEWFTVRILLPQK